MDQLPNHTVPGKGSSIIDQYYVYILSPVTVNSLLESEDEGEYL